jgi:hypothetical protein
VNGKSPAAGGKGSLISPWNSLSGVLDGRWSNTGFSVPGYTRPLLSSVPYQHIVNGAHVDVADQIGNPPIQPGDAIYLMSGNYGDTYIGAFDAPTANSDWVTVKAGLGQTPVFTTLLISRTNKWLFEAIKVQSLLGTNGNTNPLIFISDQGASYPTTDIVFDNIEASSADPSATTGWTQAQWKTNARSGFYTEGSAGSGTNGQPYTTCVSLNNSHIHDVYVGVGVFSNQTVVTGAQIDHFAADALDYGANNLAITKNYIHDNFTIDANHEDAMQGQNGPLAPGVAYNHFSNILIDSNTIVRQTDPNLQFESYLQGIDAFDEDWTNMTVTNNVVITSACYGITFSSIHNSLIAGNTVAEDGLVSTPGCVAAIEVGGATHEGPVSSTTAIRNNLTSRLAIDTRDIGFTVDHNVAMCCNPPEIGWYVNGVVQYLTKPGTYANGNVIDTGGANAEFDNFNPSSMAYNVMLKATAQAVGAGTAGSPAVDILGAPRLIPAAGAYSFPL